MRTFPEWSRNQSRWVEVAVLALTLLVAPSSWAREKTDLITLTNGDQVTGEIKQLELGILELSTDAMKIVRIEWVYVEKIESTQHFEVEDQDGEKYYGFMTPADELGRILILTPDGPAAVLDHDAMVRIDALEDRWIKRFNGVIDLGFSFTSAHSATQLSLGLDSDFRTKKHRWSNDLTAVLSDRDDADSTNWTTATSTLQRFFGQRWFAVGYGRFERNEEVQLSARYTVGGGVGRYVLQTNRSQLGLTGGVAGNRERYEGGELDEWTLEGILNAAYEFFVFGDSETTLSVGLTFYPSLTTSSRYRVELDTSVRWEFLSDFTLSASLFDSYDSQPPSEDGEKNDIRIVTSIGWKF